MTTVNATVLEDRFRRAMRSQRDALCITQRALAERLLKEHGVDLDTSAITRLENGQRVIRLGEAAAIAEILDFELESNTKSDPALVVAAKRIRRMSLQLSELADGLGG